VRRVVALLLFAAVGVSVPLVPRISAKIPREDPVAIRVDADRRQGPLTPIWAFFGYDEPNYTYMKDGRKLLSELSALSPVPVFVRTHNLLTSGDGTPALKWGSTNAYTEDAAGRPKYDWAIVDRIFDTFIQRKMKPLVEIGFMPEALSTRPHPYKHDWAPGLDYGRIYTGWTYPPTDYGKWGELVYQWVRHSVARYGRAEVESWYWEVWNEPDIGYWRGTPEEFQRLYDYAADGLRCNCVCPGITDTPMLRFHLSKSPDPEAALAERLRRPTGPARSRSCATSSSTAFAARTTRPAGPARRSTTSGFTRKGRPA